MRAVLPDIEEKMKPKELNRRLFTHAALPQRTAGVTAQILLRSLPNMALQKNAECHEDIKLGDD